jgi:hypothetical protein
MASTFGKSKVKKPTVDEVQAPNFDGFPDGFMGTLNVGPNLQRAQTNSQQKLFFDLIVLKNCLERTKLRLICLVRKDTVFSSESFLLMYNEIQLSICYNIKLTQQWLSKTNPT